MFVRNLFFLDKKVGCLYYFFMFIEQIPVRLGELEIFSYLVACPKTREGIVIDVAAECEKILNKIKQRDINLKYIVSTHGPRSSRPHCWQSGDEETNWGQDCLA